MELPIMALSVPMPRSCEGALADCCMPELSDHIMLRLGFSAFLIRSWAFFFMAFSRTGAREDVTSSDSMSRGPVCNGWMASNSLGMLRACPRSIISAQNRFFVPDPMVVFFCSFEVFVRSTRAGRPAAVA